MSENCSTKIVSQKEEYFNSLSFAFFISEQEEHDLYSLATSIDNNTFCMICSQILVDPYECTECYQAVFCYQCVKNKDDKMPCQFMKGRKKCGVEGF